MVARPVMKHNPAFLTGDELVDSFVVRQADLEMLVNLIRRNTGSNNQHALVVGPRGIGKTTLLLRTAEEIRRTKELDDAWFPLVYAEETYEAMSVGEFWLEAILHVYEQTGEQRWSDVHDELKAEPDNDRLATRALGQLMDFADNIGKRIVLVVENLNLLLGDQLTDNDGWALRKVLQNEPRVMLLASATSRFEEIDNSSKPLFEIFKIHDLKPLDAAECRAVWTSIVGREPEDNRIRPIQILTGGNPRLMAIISQFGAKHSFRDLVLELRQLVDDHTEYFRSQIDALPSTERKVYLALADLWSPATAKEVGEACRLEVNKTSSLLKRLASRGAVIIDNEKPRRKTYYLAERLYNIYYLMRRRGKQAGHVQAMVEFMVGLYGPEQLVNISRQIAEELNDIPETNARKEHLFAYESILRQMPDTSSVVQLVRATPEGFFCRPDLPESLRRVLNETPVLTAEEFRSLWPTEPSPPLPANTIDTLAEKLTQAVVRTPSNATAWIQLGLIRQTHLKSFKEAEVAYRKAIEIEPNNPWAWSQLGELLEDNFSRQAEAERAYRESIKHDSEVPWPWVRLGDLLREKGEHEEAETAYLTAIRLDPEMYWAWGQLGELLHENPNRTEEAERAYRRVLKLAPDYAWAWSQLGLLLHERTNRFEEAEHAYRKSIKYFPEADMAWSKLGLLLDETDRFEEAEESYRKAIDLNPDLVGTKGLLGDLLSTKLGRPGEGIEIFREITQSVPNLVIAWVGLFRSQLLDGTPPNVVAKSAADVLDENPDDSRMLNDFAWLFFNLQDSEEVNQQILKWSRSALDHQPANSSYAHTLAAIYLRNGDTDEALSLVPCMLGNSEHVDLWLEDAISVLSHLASMGKASETLRVLTASPSAEKLEPMVVALKRLTGENVRAPMEIMEVADDLIERIEKLRKDSPQ